MTRLLIALDHGWQLQGVPDHSNWSLRTSSLPRLVSELEVERNTKGIGGALARPTEHLTLGLLHGQVTVVSHAA